MFKKNAKKLRVITALFVIGIISVGFVLNTGIGTLSGIGWNDIVLLCPLGALGIMLASKLVIPQAIISLICFVVFVLVFGRIFCGWICPIPLVSKLRNIFKKKESRHIANGVINEAASKPLQENNLVKSKNEATSERAFDKVNSTVAALAPAKAATQELSKEEKQSLKGCSKETEGCSSCASKREKLDSRHFILGGSLASAAIFGFPVFCLICPIGLTFASILLVIRLFSAGDITWLLIAAPALLIIEVVVFRKWCHKLCPLSALMSLVGKANRTFQPSIDDNKCIEIAQGKKCGICAKTCEESIDPRHPQLGKHDMSECTRCRACVDACPGEAITIPLYAKKDTVLQRRANNAELD